MLAKIPLRVFLGALILTTGLYTVMDHYFAYIPKSEVIGYFLLFCCVLIGLEWLLRKRRRDREKSS